MFKNSVNTSKNLRTFIAAISGLNCRKFLLFATLCKTVLLTLRIWNGRCHSTNIRRFDEGGNAAEQSKLLKLRLNVTTTILTNLFATIFITLCLQTLTTNRTTDQTILFTNNSIYTMKEHNFPPLKNDNLLRAARGEAVDRVPVWVMRQAGRYLPEFQEVRKQHDFFTVCRTPELACEVTMQPLRRFDLDASIIFSDILVIPQALGMTVEMHPGVGPVFPEPLQTPVDLAKLTPEGAVGRLAYVGEAITMMRHKLEGRVPLIGFTGAPWTLMGYMIEGGGSKTMSKAKAWLSDHLEDSKRLLEMLTAAIVDYLEMQVKAGAQLLQIFESSAEHLSKEDFLRIAVPYLQEIHDKLTERLTNQSIPLVPMTLFAKGAGHSLKEQAELGYDIIGIDWTVDPVNARQAVGPNITLQGNLSPEDMYRTPDEIRTLTTEMVRKFGKTRYIANLGHGITPQTPIISMETLVDAVHKAL